MDTFISYLDYGFTFALSIYLLIRMEKKIEALTESINKLNNQK